jgi:nucleoside phosphorylase
LLVNQWLGWRKKSMSSDTPAIDVLLYIALSEEFNDLSDELIEELGDGFMPQELEDIALTVFYGKISSPALNRDFQLAVVPAGKMGINRAAAVTSSILAKLHVSDVVVLGIAGSLSSDLQPGDVFIPDSVNEYLANSATKGKGETWTFEISGNHLPTSPRLLNRFQNFRHTEKRFYDSWFQDCAARLAPLIEGEIQEAMAKAGLNIRSEIKLFAGDDRKLACGPAVGKGKAFVEWIKGEVDRKVAALDMESAGIYDAALIRTPAPRTIAIRGISDFADERKKLIEDAAKDQFRSISAKNALSLLLRAIEAGLFKEDDLRNHIKSGKYSEKEKVLTFRNHCIVSQESIKAIIGIKQEFIYRIEWHEKIQRSFHNLADWSDNFSNKINIFRWATDYNDPYRLDYISRLRVEIEEYFRETSELEARLQNGFRTLINLLSGVDRNFRELALKSFAGFASLKLIEELQHFEYRLIRSQNNPYGAIDRRLGEFYIPIDGYLKPNDILNFDDLKPIEYYLIDIYTYGSTIARLALPHIPEVDYDQFIICRIINQNWNRSDYERIVLPMRRAQSFCLTSKKGKDPKTYYELVLPQFLVHGFSRNPDVNSWIIYVAERKDGLDYRWSY